MAAQPPPALATDKLHGTTIYRASHSNNPLGQRKLGKRPKTSLRKSPPHHHTSVEGATTPRSCEHRFNKISPRHSYPQQARFSHATTSLQLRSTEQLGSFTQEAINHDYPLNLHGRRELVDAPLNGKAVQAEPPLTATRKLYQYPQAMLPHSKPLLYESRPMHQRRNGSMVTQPQPDWTQWVEVRVKVFGLTPTVTTADLWKAFSKQGSVSTIEIFEDSSGNRNGKASIRFRQVATI